MRDNNLYSLYNGKMITGVEIQTLVDDYLIEVLVYNFDLDKFDEIYPIVIKKFLGNDIMISMFTQTLLEAGINPIHKLKHIPDSYRYGDHDLVVEIIPQNILTMHKYAYAYCDHLTTVKFETENLPVIPESCFAYCSNLNNIEIPQSVDYIEACAFEWCSNLNSLKLNEGLRNIESFAFSNTGLREIELPKSLLDIGKNAFPKECIIKTYRNAPYLHKLINYQIEFLD